MSSAFLTTDGSGLSFPEFCLAMFLAKAKLGGRDVPAVLPDKVKQCVTQSFQAIQRAIGYMAPGATSFSAAPYVSQAPSYGNNQVPAMMGLGVTLPTVAPPPAMPTPAVYAPPHIPNLSMNASHMERVNSGVSSPSLAGSPALHSSSGPTPEPPASGWAISLSEKAQYDSIFKAWDMGNTGFITRMCTLCISVY